MRGSGGDRNRGLSLRLLDGFLRGELVELVHCDVELEAEALATAGGAKRWWLYRRRAKPASVIRKHVESGQ